MAAVSPPVFLMFAGPNGSANVAYIFDNTQTAQLILQAIDGALNTIEPTVPNWVETGLILPCS
jgi:hypothetical protein